MREEIVHYLESNPYVNEGFPLLEHLADNEFATWSNYTNRMSQYGVYGDQLTLYTAANVYNIDVQIVSSLGATCVQPVSKYCNGYCVPWTFCQNQGEHYVILEHVVRDQPSCGGEVLEESNLEDITEEYTSETEGNIDMGDVVNNDDCDAEIQEGVDDLVDDVVEVKEILSDQQNETDGEEEQIALQFVPDEDVDSLASGSNRDCYLENLPNELLEKIFQMVLMSSATLSDISACHAYQSLCRVKANWNVAEVQSFVMSVRSLIKKYGTSSGLIMKLRSIISDQNGPMPGWRLGKTKMIGVSSKKKFRKKVSYGDLSIKPKKRLKNKI